MIAGEQRIALPPIISTAALQRHDTSHPIVHLSGAALGTRWTVQFVSRHNERAVEIEASIKARLAALVFEMSQWKEDSILSRFNRSRAGSWFSIPLDFATVMKVALDMAERTGGAFDPTHGRAAALLGYGATIPDGDLEQAMAQAGWKRLAYDREAGRLRQPGGLWLDFSGIAKGYAVDAVADLMLGIGIEDALVEIGGELIGRGVKPDGQPWWVDLEQPPDFNPTPIRIGLHNLAVATSADYVRGAHTLDPWTGRPLERSVMSVSVIHSAAIWADAWATALTVLGMARGMEYAERENLAVRMVGLQGGRMVEKLSSALIGMMES